MAKKPKADDKAAQTATVGPGGALVVNPEIKEPVPPAVAPPAVPKELQRTIGADEVGEGFAAPLVNLPYGSEPRNLDHTTGQIIPHTDEQKREAHEGAAARMREQADATKDPELKRSLEQAAERSEQAAADPNKPQPAADEDADKEHETT